MTSDAASPVSSVPEGYRLAPIHSLSEGAPLAICVVLRSKADAAQGRFIILGEVPGSRSYLGATADAQGRVQEWLEIWVQTLDLSDPGIAGLAERLENRAFDQRWHRGVERRLATVPAAVIVTGMEEQNPPPILIDPNIVRQGLPFVQTTPSRWRLCQDDALLESLGLPAYSKSPFRYLHNPDDGDGKTLLATQNDAPSNEHVQPLDKLTEETPDRLVFNGHAGRIRLHRLSPLELDDYLAVLEGKPWEATGADALPVVRWGIYAELQTWSRTPKGLPFLLHGLSGPVERLNEVLFLKLSMLRDLFREARAYVKSQQLPLLNLTPASFRVQLQSVGDAFPGLWSARGMLVRPGQALPLELQATDQRYFIRLGRIQPSPYLPEELAAHSAGAGSVRVRDVKAVSAGVVLEGTLVPEDYLSANPDDLLWFRLPIEGRRLELYAHTYLEEGTGPKEVRFRTLPTQLPEEVVAILKSSVGAGFPRSQYEVWPMLSSPGDLYSLGVFAIRILLANTGTRLAVVKDEVLGLSRLLGKDPVPHEGLIPRLHELLDRETQLKDLVSPHSLAGLDLTPEQARTLVVPAIWWETVGFVLRLFPGMGAHSFCRGLGDVSPLALETAFDQPLQELEALTLRQRSLLTPSHLANHEIASVLLEQMETP